MTDTASLISQELSSDPPCRRLAVVLFNLGGPDSPEAVKPFLQNLFSDPAIIGAPGPIRFLLSRFISSRRAPTTREIYKEIGNKSPLLELTQDQARVLARELQEDPDLDLEAAEVFVAMRYWHPFAEETLEKVKAFEPDRIVLLPLYPQFSTTTSRSSLRDWKEKAVRVGLSVPTSSLCCYPGEESFVAAHVDLLRKAMAAVPEGQKVRVLFSAHGLPKSIVDKGDPYQWQVEQTVAAVVRALGEASLDHSVCYQSRVTPQEWIGPATEDEIARAGADGVAVVLTPIAFVSEHSETLVELDIEYAELAKAAGVPAYIRVPALGVHFKFMDGLRELVKTQVLRQTGQATCSASQTRICPEEFSQCPMRIEQTVQEDEVNG